MEQRKHRNCPKAVTNLSREPWCTLPCGSNSYRKLQASFRSVSYAKWPPRWPKKTLCYLFILKVGMNAFNINANLHIPCNSIQCHTTRMREIKIKQIGTEFRGQKWLAILIVIKMQMTRVNSYVTTQNGSECSSCCDEALPVHLKGKTIRSV